MTRDAPGFGPGDHGQGHGGAATGAATATATDAPFRGPTVDVLEYESARTSGGVS